MNDKNRFFNMADVYDRLAPSLVPKYDFLQTELLTFLKISEIEGPVVVDLGGGSGRLLERILKMRPTALCYWVDYSDDFLRVAKKRLADYADRVEFIQCRIEDDWESKVAVSPNAVVSSSAIHHLTSDEKRSVYSRCHDILKTGGWFANIDEMKTMNKDAYLRSLQLWTDHVDNYGAKVGDEERALYQEWCKNFDRWKHRNIDGIDEHKSKGDDLHDPFMDQVQWLAEVGFQSADVIIKYYLWCVVVGQKV